MKTEVQSFLQEEVLDLVTSVEALDEWNRLIEDMGLSGQQKTISKEKASPMSFLHMTPSMTATFETLCPREVELKDYEAAPIPFKALELIKLAITEDYFDRIVVRYDDKGPDPVAIGQKMRYYTWSPSYRNITKEEAMAMRAAGNSGIGHSVEQQYLIARWGAEAASLDKLAKQAKERFLREKKSEVAKRIKELKNELDTLEEDATIKFNA